MKTVKSFITKVSNGDNKAGLTAWALGFGLLVIVVVALHFGGCVDLSQLKK